MSMGMMAAEGRVVLVSGANRGIGLAVARVLKEAGYTLSLGARDPASIPADLGGAHAHAWDATDKAASAAWVAAAAAELGRIDGVVLNAGIMAGGGLEDGTEEEIDAMLAVNFKGPLWLVRAALPHLRQAGSGRVVNVVSLAGKRLMNAGMLGYSASKFASHALTHAVRHAAYADGVRATSICPGLVDTDMVSHVTPPEGQHKIAPETIGAAVAYALSLPNEAAVAEVLMNSRMEAMF